MSEMVCPWGVSSAPDRPASLMVAPTDQSGGRTFDQEETIRPVAGPLRSSHLGKKQAPKCYRFLRKVYRPTGSYREKSRPGNIQDDRYNPLQIARYSPNARSDARAGLFCSTTFDNSFCQYEYAPGLHSQGLSSADIALDPELLFCRLVPLGSYACPSKGPKLGTVPRR